jgi:hypothetical protein
MYMYDEWNKKIYSLHPQKSALLSFSRHIKDFALEKGQPPSRTSLISPYPMS